MSHFHARSNHSCHSFDGASIRRIGSVCQYLLNIVAEAATRASERSRYAALPRRYFDDYTHRTAYTDNGFRDFLRAHGWKTVHSEPRFMPFTLKSRLPAAGWLVRLYLASPFRPLAGQFLVVAEKP